jgi:hypothetical protein
VPVGIEGACYPAAGADHYGSMLLVFFGSEWRDFR